jgi:hypothetical protein
MKSLILGAIVLALALALAFVLWFSTRQGPSIPGDLGAAPPSKSAAAHGDVDKANRDAKDEEAKLEAPEMPATARADVAQAAAADTRARVALRGSIVAPKGGGVDDALEVFALDEKTDIDGVFGLLVPNTEDAIAFAPSMKILARVAVQPDLSFALQLPADAKTVHVIVIGHFWFTRESTPVEMTPDATVSLAPVCGASIAGRVEPPAGSTDSARKIDALTISIENSMDNTPGAFNQATRTRRRAHVKNGSFEFHALDTHSGYVLRTAPSDLAALEQNVADLVPARETTTLLQLQQGGSVRGVVKSADGAPLAHVDVSAAKKGAWFGFDDRAVRKTKSDDKGVFELSAVTPGRVLVKAEKEGFLEGDPVKVDVVDGGRASDIEVVLGLGSSITGSVTWADGKPAVDVQVSVEFDKSQLAGMGAFNAARGAKGSAKSDSQGKFVVTGLGAVPFTVTAEALSAEDKIALEKSDAKTKRDHMQHARRDGVAPGTKDLALVLKPAATVAGIVLDTTGAPVKEFQLRAWSVGTGMLADLGQDVIEESLSADDGKFRLPIPREGKWKITAASTGFATSAPIEFTMPRNASDPELALTIEKASIVKGVVRDIAGVPVGGADVDLSTGQPAWQKALSNEKAPHAVSEKDGTFVLTGLRSGKNTLVADSKQSARSEPAVLDLAAGETREGVVLVLRDGGKLTGEVYENGKPASGYLVQSTNMKSFDNEAARTDSQGRFALEHVEPGTWQVVAMPTSALASTEDGNGAPDMGAMISNMKMTSTEVTDGQETHVVLGAAPTDPVAVSGRVTHAGEPYKGAMISFVAEGKNALASMKAASVAADGTYAVKLDGPGKYLVSVQKMSGKPGEQGVVEFAREVPLAKECTLDFELPTGRISGRVLDSDGNAAKDVPVSLSPEAHITTGTMWGGQYHESSTDGEGRFDIEALRPGTYSIAVGGSALGGMLGNEDSVLGRAVRSGLRISEGEWMKNVDFKLEKPGTVEITVVDESGKAVEAASVFARDSEGRLVERLSMRSTSAEGQVKYGGLAPGRYTFQARSKGRASPDSAAVTVASGETKTVKVALSVGTKLIVRAVDGDDKPVQAAIQVFDEAGRDVAGMMALAEVMESFGSEGLSTGEPHVGPLAPGKYRVRGVANGKTVEKPVTLSSQPERTVTLKFEK